MKPKPDSLKEEIEKIITNIFDRVDNSTWKEARDQATTAILELIDKRLPKLQSEDDEIRNIDYEPNDVMADMYNRGWNACREAMLDNLGIKE